MSVAAVDAATAVVVTANVPLVAPAATVTLAGTVADVLLLDNVTNAPPVGAAPFSVTVPVAPTPPTTLVGLTDTAVSASGGGGPPARISTTAIAQEPADAGAERPMA